MEHRAEDEDLAAPELRDGNVHLRDVAVVEREAARQLRGKLHGGLPRGGTPPVSGMERRPSWATVYWAERSRRPTTSMLRTSPAPTR